MKIYDFIEHLENLMGNYGNIEVVFGRNEKPGMYHSWALREKDLEVWPTNMGEDSILVITEGPDIKMVVNNG